MKPTCVSSGRIRARPWDGRGHFFSAAAEAMRRILVENARRKSRQKHGGDLIVASLIPTPIAAPMPDDDLIALDEALEKLSRLDPPIAELVKLRYFADLTIPQAAEILGISPRTADFHWKYAKAWLRDELGAESPEKNLRRSFARNPSRTAHC